MIKREARSQMIFTLFVALIAIMLLVGGQTLLKVGLNEIGGVSLFDGNPVGSLLGLLRTPWIILGFFCYGVSAILWLDVLSKLDFSFAFLSNQNVSMLSGYNTSNNFHFIHQPIYSK